MLGGFTTNEEGLETLERVRGATGSIARVPVDKQLERGRTVGATMNMFFCLLKILKKKRKYS